VRDLGRVSPAAFVGRNRTAAGTVEFVALHKIGTIVPTLGSRVSACGREYALSMPAPATGEDWFELTPDVLPVGAVHDWAVRHDCGAVVVFTGTVRDHAEGRDGVTALHYEAYSDAVRPVFERIAAETRKRHPGAARIALLHRTGDLALGEVSVVVAVSSAHRPDAFEAARFAIDALKESAPIWKKESWSGGDDWGTGAKEITRPDQVGSGT
jgi:molybdopterin synthase catalytic subunit